MEEIEVEEAVKDLANEASLPLGLHFVVYGSESIRDRQQLHCFPLCQTSQPHLTVWRKELASSTVNKFIQRALENASQPGTTDRRRLESKK